MEFSWTPATFFPTVWLHTQHYDEFLDPVADLCSRYEQAQQYETTSAVTNTTQQWNSYSAKHLQLSLSDSLNKTTA